MGGSHLFVRIVDFGKLNFFCQGYYFFKKPLVFKWTSCHLVFILTRFDPKILKNIINGMVLIGTLGTCVNIIVVIDRYFGVAGGQGVRVF